MLSSITVLCAICFITGCSSSKLEDETKEDEVQGNCIVTECMEKIDVSNTVEEINFIIGFEPTKDELSGNQTWKLDAKNWITLKPYGDSFIIQATIDKDTIKNDNVKLPTSAELKELLDNGSFTYEQLVEKLGGVEGALESKSSTSVGYVWADKNGQRLGATFNNESGKCTVASYR